MLSANYSLAIVFVWDCRQVLISLKMLRDVFSSTQSYNSKSFILDREAYCFIVCTFSLFVCHQRYDLHTDSHWFKTRPRQCFLFPGHVLRECSFSPPPYWKTAGHCNKSVNFHNLLKFFPCSLSPFVRGRCWQLTECVCLMQSILYVHVKGMYLSLYRN